MKLAIIGYGKMGREIEKVALQRNHEIICIIGKDNISDFDSEQFRTTEAAIEFTEPEAVSGNILKCFSAGVPVVTGTTGWLQNLNSISEECIKRNQALLYASNFSLGVNLFFELNRQLAKMMNQFDYYHVEIEEIHHVHKLDSPSGTAISLAEGIIENLNRKTSWVNNRTASDEQIPVTSIRKGEIAGIHTIKYNSGVDCIEIKHSAKNRVGFAVGAVLAAEFIRGKKGIFTMTDLLRFSGVI